jgi:hypothetical protein
MCCQFAEFDDQYQLTFTLYVDKSKYDLNEYIKILKEKEAKRPKSKAPTNDKSVSRKNDKSSVKSTSKDLKKE